MYWNGAPVNTLGDVADTMVDAMEENRAQEYLALYVQDVGIAYTTLDNLKYTISRFFEGSPILQQRLRKAFLGNW